MTTIASSPAASVVTGRPAKHASISAESGVRAAAASQATGAVVHQDRLPWVAGLLAFVVVIFPAVQLAIESVLVVFADRPDPAAAVGLGAMSLVLLVLPLLVAAAVRRRSTAALVLALLAGLTVLIGTACAGFN